MMVGIYIYVSLQECDDDASSDARLSRVHVMY